jgi:hypothetical protein
LSEAEKVIVENDAIYVKKSGYPLYIKTADICAMTGKSNQWIGQLVSKGTLTKHRTKHGMMFEAKETIMAYCNMIEERTKEENFEISESEIEKAEAEARIKKSKAIIAEMEAEEVQGKMHRSEDVAKMTEDLIYAVRGMMIALPGRLAVDVKNAETAAEAAELIKAEVFKIMEELSQYKYDSKKYEERVRERRRWDALDTNPDDES